MVSEDYEIEETAPFIFPNYTGSGTANIPATILKHFGQETETPVNQSLEHKLLGADKILFLFIDGLGYEQLLHHGESLRFFSPLMKTGEAITACFPSTTAASVATFTTGLTPQQHGILGYKLYLKEYNTVANMLKYTSATNDRPILVDPATFFPFTTLGEKLTRAGIGSHAVIPQDIVNTTFTKMTLRATEQHSHHNLQEFCDTILHILKQKEKTFVHAYISLYDTVCHLYGPHSPYARTYLHEIDNNLFTLMKKISSPDTCVVASADHGHIATRPAHVIFYQEHEPFLNALDHVTGESRMNYLYCKPEHKSFVKQYFRTHFSDYAVLMRSSHALKQGLFGIGEPYEKTNERIGDFIVIAKDNYTLSSHRFYLAGMHGGLSKQEMLVPLLTHRSSA